MTEQQKEEILLSISKNISINSKLLMKHDELFEKVFIKLEEHDKMFESRDKLLVLITKELALLRKDMDKKFEAVYEELRHQRQSIAKLENDLLDKISEL